MPKPKTLQQKREALTAKYGPKKGLALFNKMYGDRAPHQSTSPQVGKGKSKPKDETSGVSAYRQKMASSVKGSYK